jgi:two-component system sensor histidine kinase YesM
LFRKLYQTWFSLTGRLIICLALSLVSMIAATFLIFYGSWQDAKNAAYEDFATVGRQMQSELTETIASCENVSRIAGYSTAVQRFLLSDDPELVIQSLAPALNHLDSVMQLSDRCSNIFLYSDNGRHLYANTSNTEQFQQLLQNRHFDQDVTISSSFFARMPGNSDSSTVFYCTPVFSVEHSYATNRIIAAVMCDMEQITQRIVGAEEEDPDAAVLLYSGGIVSSTRPLKDTEADMLENIKEGMGYCSIGNVRYLTTRISMPEAYWDFIYFIPESEISYRAFRLMNQSPFYLCGTIVLISVLLTLLLRSLNKNVHQITGDMNRLGYNIDPSFPVHIREPRLAELKTISRSANRMLDRLNESFRKEQQTQEQLYRAIQAQSEAQMMGYRSQINPHFLFNTLECMRSMAHSRSERDMETLISSMALTFRYSLYAGTMVSLSQELSHVNSYFDVIRTRFPGRYTLKIMADQDAMNHPMLSMILQPIVENAINHAFVDRESNCRLLIKAFQNEKKCLVVRIADNGVGMSQSELEDLDRRMRQGEEEPSGGRGSIGLHNIFQRMKLTFGGHFHIRFRSKKGFYTVVELIIPEKASLSSLQVNELERDK